jgi:hypothetical protein
MVSLSGELPVGTRVVMLLILVLSLCAERTFCSIIHYGAKGEAKHSSEWSANGPA